MTDTAEIKSRAIGKWKGILTALGVSPNYLTGKHSPCPLCGGKDRFRFTDYHDNGDYICNQCGNGDGFNLLMAVNGYSFVEACEAVANQLGFDTKTPLKTPVKPSKPFLVDKQAITPKDNLNALNRILWGAKPITQHSPCGKYLSNRGLDWLAIKDGLRDVYYRDALDYFNQPPFGKPYKVGSYPVMISKISKGDDLTGLHLTYLQNDGGYWRKADIIDPVTGKQLPAKKMRSRYTGAISGGAVRLYSPNDGVLTVTEGIETALAVREMRGLNVWACLSTSGMKSLIIPDGIHTLNIVYDNDENHAGQKAMTALYTRATNDGLTVRHWTPPTIGADALDVLNHKKNTGLIQ